MSEDMFKGLTEADRVAAKEALAKAEAEAKALLSQLEANEAPKGKTYTLPSPFPPGEEPDPVKGVAQPEGYNNDLFNALDGNFKPANLDDMHIPTNTASHSVDFAQKIREANKHRK